MGNNILHPHLKDVGLPLAVDASERSINGPGDAPHVLDELWITRKHRVLVQLEEVLPCKPGSSTTEQDPDCTLKGCYMLEEVGLTSEGIDGTVFQLHEGVKRSDTTDLSVQVRGCCDGDRGGLSGSMSLRSIRRRRGVTFGCNCV